MGDPPIPKPRMWSWWSNNNEGYNHGGAWVNQGTWNAAMQCKENGFRQMTGREESHGLKGIVNVQAFCHNEELEMTSNDNMDGEYNPDLKCRNGGKAVGIQVREEIYHGII